MYTQTVNVRMKPFRAVATHDDETLMGHNKTLCSGYSTPKLEPVLMVIVVHRVTRSSSTFFGQVCWVEFAQNLTRFQFGVVTLDDSKRL